MQDLYKLFPKIKKINIVRCPVEDVSDADKYISIKRMRGILELSAWSPGEAGHSHIIKEDPFFGHVCVRDEQFLYNEDQPHDLIWHEYGHVLNSPFYNTLTLNGVKKEAHGKAWQSVMKILGKPELANLSPLEVPEELYEKLMSVKV